MFGCRHLGPLALAIALAAACAPVVRPATFRGAYDTLTDATLVGPFDGQVIDVTTREPVQGATVVAVWSYDQGDGFVGPAGSTTVSMETDAAGRYRIRRNHDHVAGDRTRLVSFRLFVYKRGYAAYRSDTKLDGNPRTDFVARHNEVELHKWESTDSHADHLLYLAPTRELAQLTAWERAKANADLYRSSGGKQLIPEEAAPTARPDAATDTPTRPVANLVATDLLRPDEISLRTGQMIEFEVASLVDIPATPTYHGVHLRAIERDESYDVSFRVWLHPEDGFDPIIATFNATLPGVPVSDEVTDETWVADFDTVRAVAFIDRKADAAVLVTCGVGQCVDVATALVLAKLAHGNLDRVRSDVAVSPSEPSPADNDVPATPTEVLPDSSAGDDAAAREAPLGDDAASEAPAGNADDTSPAAPSAAPPGSNPPPKPASPPSSEAAPPGDAASKPTSPKPTPPDATAPKSGSSKPSSPTPPSPDRQPPSPPPSAR